MDAASETFVEALVSRAGPSEHTFEELLADCPTLAFRVALGVLHNRAEAEDVAQEALLRAYRNLNRLRDPARFRGWLARTAWHLALDHIRGKGRRERRELAACPPLPAETAEDLAASSEFQTHLQAAIDELPEKLRIVLLLAAIEGHDTREVAALLEIPEGTVKSRLYAARKALAEKLKWIVNPAARS